MLGLEFDLVGNYFVAAGGIIATVAALRVAYAMIRRAREVNRATARIESSRA